MAKNLLNKLNVLVQASIRDTVGSGIDLSFLKRVGKNLDKEVAALHRELDTAAIKEGEFQSQIAAMEAEILKLDEQADLAVQNGNDAQARYLVQQMHRTKQQITMLQSELDQHRYAVHELMQQVNHLESIIEVAKREAVEDVDAPTDEVESRQLTLSDAIRKARETAQKESEVIETASSNLDTSEQSSTKEAKSIKIKVTNSKPVEPEITNSDITNSEEDDAVVEQDLAARRARLQKPGS